MLVVALIVASIIRLVALDFWQEKQRYRARATVATQNIAQLIDQHVNAVLDGINTSLQSIFLYCRAGAIANKSLV